MAGYSIKHPTTNPEEIKIFSDTMKEDVHRNISEARGDDPINAFFRASEMFNTLTNVFQFSSWIGRRGRRTRDCKESEKNVILQQKRDHQS